ncbi:hypothetical protein D3870_05040 [Noviherbaspirillum cavernae]|uniref:Uncharacterized protein n=1 Tax=Noviherbaspirillum cavernae TaxID=2320862 RepID=A0A418WZ01_9BURK|nr:hypothetical protein [Noviherbaspirillum cavernae]RJG05469.1 hypothetical protein D3870_05040 [Noviherbaspirillum cavernae]
MELNAGEYGTIVFTIEDKMGAERKFLGVDITGYSKQAIEALKSTHAALKPNPVLIAEMAVEEDNENDDTSSSEAEGDASTEDQAKKDRSRPRNDNILRKAQEESKRLLAANQIPSSGWNEDSIRQVLDMLPEPQKNVVLHAAAAGGPLSRVAVYQATRRAPDRSLKGFTKPTARVKASLQKKGVLPMGADDLLQQIYDPAVATYQPVQGFKIPLEVAVLIRKMGLVPEADL